MSGKQRRTDVPADNSRMFMFTITYKEGGSRKFFDYCADRDEAFAQAEAILEQNKESIVDIEFQDMTDAPQ